MAVQVVQSRIGTAIVANSRAITANANGAVIALRVLMKSNPTSVHISALILAMMALGSAGCVSGEEDDANVATDSEALETGNGQKLNGQKLNGQKLNGTTLAAVDLTGVALNGATSGGVAVTSVKLVATVFTGTRATKAISGTAFVGATFVGKTSAMTTVPLRIDAVIPLTAPNADVLTYRVSYDSGGVWAPLCGLDTASQPIAAIAVNGLWDLRQGVATGGSYIADAASFTFACRNAAIGKCVEAGYKPWKSAFGFPSLQGHLTACTRLLRADYCGDGTSWTVDGRLVDIYDISLIQLDTNPTWTFEAYWATTGATCVSDQRYYDASKGIPACLLTRHSPNCIGHGAGMALILDRYYQKLIAP
jgi:ADYC domain